MKRFKLAIAYSSVKRLSLTMALGLMASLMMSSPAFARKQSFKDVGG